MSWEKVKLGDLCDMNSGGTPRRNNLDFYGGTIPWAKISDIENANGYINSTEENITQEALKSIGNRIFPKGTLLLAMYGSVGKTAITTIEMSTNQAILGIRTKNQNQISIPYLKYWFYTIRQSLLHRAVGGTLQNISLGIVRELQVPLPKFSIQKKIAAILDKADALRKKDQQLLAKYDELLQSIFYDMFGDPVKNEKGWERNQLQYFGDWKAGGTPSRSNQTFFEGNIPWITSGELNNLYIEDSIEKISEEAVEKSNTKKIEPGSILLGMYDTAALKSSISKKVTTCNQAIAYARLDDKKCNTLFIYYYIQLAKEHLRRMQRGVRQKNMNLSMIKETEAINPPHNLQNKFATIAQNIQQQKQQVKQQMEQSENLFQSLLQRAFKEELVKE